MKHIALFAALGLLAACGQTPEEKPVPTPEAKVTPAPEPQIMQWSDLLHQTQPLPDQTISYGDDPLQVIDIWKPEGEAPHPAVIMIHGGCWQTSVAERDIMNWIAGDLRSHGVGVWNIEYRGTDREGGGYPGTYQDVAKAADMFVSEAATYNFRTDRVIVIGHSAGGQLALWLANRPALPKGALRGDNPLRVDLAISEGGLPDLRAAATRIDHACGTEAPVQMAGPDYTMTSPAQMKPGSARQVLFNNARDPISPPAFGMSYINQVKAMKAGKSVKLRMIVTPGEGHVELVAPESKSWTKQRELILDTLKDEMPQPGPAGPEAAAGPGDTRTEAGPRAQP